MLPDEQQEQAQSPLIRGENFESLYANNVQFQPFEWDLKIIFGELDIPPGKQNVVVEQHTAISIPWLQAKLMLFYLGLQVAVHEMSNGPIQIPKALIPAEPTPPSGDLADDPMAHRVYEYIRVSREKFLASEP